MSAWEIVAQFIGNILTFLLEGIYQKSIVVVYQWVALRKYLKHIIEENEAISLQGILSHGHLVRPVEVKRNDVVIPLSLSLEWSSDTLQFEEPHRYLDTSIEQGASKGRKRQIIRFDKILQEFSVTNQVVIIQGAAGSGKSTSLRWLALDLAKSALRKLYFFQAFFPRRIPIFLRLNEDALKLQGHLSLEQYLQDRFAHIHKHLPARLSKLLQKGQCIVLFDGLDEAGDDNLRRDVVDNISRFIAQANQKSNSRHFNRFMITSRTTSYSSLELERISAPCSYYTIHGLKDKQIQDFLKKWFLAVERSPIMKMNNEQKLTIWQDHETKRAKQVADERWKDLWSNIRRNPDIRQLAETPLTLANLALLQLSGGNLPHHPLDLYQKVTHTLLMRNRTPGHTLFKKGELHHAEQVLGELAYANYPLSAPLTRGEVEDKTRKAMGKFDNHRTFHLNDEEIQQFINRLSSSGLFVEDEHEGYSFTHRMFQEYFVALHLLEHHSLEELKEFVLEYYHSNAWRELLLHVITVKSHKRDIQEKRQATELIQAVADHNNVYDSVLQRNLLFAASSIGRCHQQSITGDLQRVVANRLFDVYGDELGKGRYRQVQQEIERVGLDWLRGLSSSDDEHSLPKLLEAWRKALCNADTDMPMRQEGAIRLLTILVPEVFRCHSLVLHALLPPLIRLADLPDEHCPPEMRAFLPLQIRRPVPTRIAAYAFVALRLLYSTGPAGWLHKEWQRWNEGSVELIQRLAQHAHERNYLFTLAALPDKRESPNWRKQIEALRGWKHEELSNLQKELLKYSDTVRYPYAYLIKQMLERELATPKIRWLQIWDTYLRNTMETGHGATYQLCLDLRLLLCKDDWQKRKQIAEELMATLSTSNRYYQQQIQALFTITHLYQRELRDSHDRRNAIYLRDLRDKQYLRDMQDLRYQRDLLDVQQQLHILDILDIRYLIEMPKRNLEYLANMLKILNLRAMRDFRDESYPRYLLYLKHLQEGLDLLLSITVPDMRSIVDLRDKLDRDRIVTMLCALLEQKHDEISSTVLYALYSVIATYEALPVTLLQKARASIQQFEQYCQPLPTEYFLLIRGISSKFDQISTGEGAPIAQEEVNQRAARLQRLFQAEEFTRADVAEIFKLCIDGHALSEEQQSTVKAATLQQTTWNLLDQKRRLEDDALSEVLQALNSGDASICAAAGILLKNCQPISLILRKEGAEKIMHILENDQLSFRSIGLLSPFKILRLVDVLFETLQVLAE